MEAKQISVAEKYKNKANEEFEYTLYRHTLSPEHNYWLYTVQVKHATWGFRAFGIYATKEACPTQDLAEHLAKTLGIEAVKGRLEQASPQGFPMVFPSWFEGWWVL